MGQLLLLRHGQTEWSAGGRHTGLTDVPLTAEGDQQARQAGRALTDRRPVLVLASPLQRARRTAELAGFGDRVELEPLLQEWDYGGYEGLTTEQVRARTKPDWEVFADGVAPGRTPGESLERVAERGRAVLERVRPALARGDVLLVGHGHALRILAAVWLDAPPQLGAQLLLDPATLSVLGEKHDVPAVVTWNLPPGRPLP